MVAEHEKEPGIRPRRVPPERPGRKGGKRDRNRRERTEALIVAGRQLFLERGIPHVTIDEIAKEAGMAKGNFYRYFEDKTDLVEAIMEPVAARFREGMRACSAALDKATTPEELFAAYTMLSMELTQAAFDHLEAAQLYLQERRAPAVGEVFRNPNLARTLQLAIDHGLLRVNDPRVSALAVVGAVEHLALAVVSGPLQGAGTDSVAQVLISMVLDGVRRR